jgi:hypothetical protein
MTPEQKRKLDIHVAFNQPISRMENNGEYYFLNDGDIIEFTDIYSYSTNSKYEINNNPSHKIWFSQLSQFFINSEVQLGWATIKISGKEKGIYEFDDISFYNTVKGKRFMVRAEGPFYIVNNGSETKVNEGLYTYSDILAFIKRCINDNKIDKIGDLLKKAKLYDLIEI